MANELTKAGLDGTSLKVPIGSPVITNKPAGNSSSIKALMTGQPLTLVQMDTIEALGYDGKQAARNSATNELEFVEPEVANARRAVQWSFDRDGGEIVFVRSTGDIVVISGFLRQIDFGVGPQGQRGNPGKDGEDAKEGRDGKDGPTGCAGRSGIEGRTGDIGDYGLEGPVGPDGLAGAPGPTGPQGVQGGEGIPGQEGKRGPKGFSCPVTLTGPEGAPGREMNKAVGLQPFPGATDLIWAAPEDCLCAIDPADADFEDNSVVGVSTTTRVAPDLLCPAGQTIGGVIGGVTTASGTFTETIMSDGTIQRSAPNYNGAYCAVATTNQPHVVITERYTYNSVQVSKVVFDSTPDSPVYYFYDGAGLQHKVRRFSKGAVFNYSQANPVIRDDGMMYWQGGLQAVEQHPGYTLYIYTLGGSFKV